MRMRLGRSCISACVLVGVAAFVRPAPAEAQGMNTPVSSDGSEVGSSQAELAAESHPFRGTGVLSQEDRAETFQGYVPSREEIQSLRAAASRIPQTESVLGVDTRMRVNPTTAYPQRATALITFTGGFCTGWFYGPDIVATAGHCVHSGGGGGAWRTNVRVWPGYNAGSAPYGSFPAQSLHSVTGWTVSGNEQYDYGAINLNGTPGNTVGWYGIWWQAANLLNEPTIVLGYPGDKSPSQSQWVSADKVRTQDTFQVFYKLDTAGGPSGSALWQDRPSGSAFCANGPCAYGIHAYGLHGGSPHSTHNHGVFIRQALYNNLVTWRNLP